MSCDRLCYLPVITNQMIKTSFVLLWSLLIKHSLRNGLIGPRKFVSNLAKSNKWLLRKSKLSNKKRFSKLLHTSFYVNVASTRCFSRAPNDCFLEIICAEKQMLPRIFYCLRTVKISRWLLHSCTIFEAYLIISLRFSEV